MTIKNDQKLNVGVRVVVNGIRYGVVMKSEVVPEYGTIHTIKFTHRLTKSRNMHTHEVTYARTPCKQKIEPIICMNNISIDDGTTP